MNLPGGRPLASWPDSVDAFSQMTRSTVISSPRERRLDNIGKCLLIISCTLGVAAVNGPAATLSWFWIDEILTAEAINKNLGALVADRYAAGHSPLYFVLAKLWVLLAGGRGELAYPNELLLRAPSMIAMGLAGGVLGVCAWRTWGVASGLLFCTLWMLHPTLARYSIDARPYALMMLFLAIGIWANTRAIGRSSPLDRTGKLTWIASAAAPILMTATIPLGAIAAISIELACILWIYRLNDDAIRSAWRKRIIVVWPAIAMIVAILAPGIAAKSADFWTETLAPVSLERIIYTVGQLLAAATWPDSWDDVAPFIAAILVIVLLGFGLAVQKRTTLLYMATFLVVVFPVLIVAASMVKPLVVPRYLLPAIPGFLLLAVAGYSGVRNRTIAVAVGIVLSVSMALALAEKRPQVRSAEMEARFIHSLGIPSVIGASTNRLLKRGLNYYFPRRMGIDSRVSDLVLPLNQAAIPEIGVYWLFDWPPLTLTESDLRHMPVTCEFKIGRGRIYAVARSSDDLPDAIKECALPSPKTKATGLSPTTAPSRQSRTTNPTSSCSQEKSKLCAGVEPGEGRLYACLIEHWDQLSDACRQEMMPKTMFCSGDISKFCATVKPGEGRIFRCLKEYKEQLSDECRREKEL